MAGEKYWRCSGCGRVTCSDDVDLCDIGDNEHGKWEPVVVLPVAEYERMRSQQIVVTASGGDHDDVAFNVVAELARLRGIEARLRDDALMNSIAPWRDFSRANMLAMRRAVLGEEETR